LSAVRTAAIVLAAGASRRMGSGGNKMLLELDGELLVHRAVRRALDASLDPVVLVTGFDRDRVSAAVRSLACAVVHNPDFTGSSALSLHAGLRALAPDVDAAVVTLGDMVHVTSGMLRALPLFAAASGAPLVVSRYGEVTAPPLLFRRALFAELLAWHGEGCGKAVVRAHAHEAAYADWPAGALLDVDTPADWTAAGGRAD
jgi:molybdenum cofactor cytidylyltransferase